MVKYCYMAGEMSRTNLFFGAAFLVAAFLATVFFTVAGLLSVGDSVALISSLFAMVLYPYL